jgi:hypothetical protein
MFGAECEGTASNHGVKHHAEFAGTNKRCAIVRGETGFTRHSLTNYGTDPWMVTVRVASDRTDVTARSSKPPLGEHDSVLLPRSASGMLHTAKAPEFNFAVTADPLAAPGAMRLQVSTTLRLAVLDNPDWRVEELDQFDLVVTVS